MLKPGEKFRVDFDPTFKCTDIDIADIGAPPVETPWCLLEVSKEQLAELQAGQLFRFVAHTSGGGTHASLCTESATFNLEYLENSNSVLVASVRDYANKDDEAPAVAENEAIVTTSDHVCVGEEKSSTVPPDLGSGTSEPGGAAGAPAEPLAVPAEPARNYQQCNIFGQVRGNMFMKPMFGDLQKVREILAPHVLGQGTGGGDAPRPVTLKALKYSVAASDSELNTILEEGPYVEFERAWYWMPAPLEREILDVAISVVTANGWDPTVVDGELLLDAVQKNLGDAGKASVPSCQILRKALRSVTSGTGTNGIGEIAATQGATGPATQATPPAAEATQAQVSSETVLDGSSEATPEGAATALSASQQERIITLDAGKIRQFRALQLLRKSPTDVRSRYELPNLPPRKRTRGGGGGGGAASRDPPLTVDEFMTVFREFSGNEVTLEDVKKMLGTSMYINQIEGTIHALDTTILPSVPRERLKRLFELMSHWAPDSLEALMAPVLKGMKAAAWLLKFARTVHVTFDDGTENRMLIKKFAGL